MRRPFNLLWFIYVVLIGITLIISAQQCIRNVPYGFEGVAVTETDTFGEFSLPEPSYSAYIGVLLPGCTLCVICFFFKKYVLNLIGCISSLIQCAIVAFSIPFKKLISYTISNASCSIGRLLVRHELTLMGYITVGMCILCFAYSLFLTSVYRKYRI